jgi:hypothetical protein
MTTRSKVVETDAQIQTLRHHIFDECVAITSSIDTIPRAMVPRRMRDRWLRELRQATGAVALVKGAASRQAPDQDRTKTGARIPQEEDPMSAAVNATAIHAPVTPRKEQERPAECRELCGR